MARSKAREPLVLALSLIVLGTAWLLNSFGVIAGVNWAWTLPLAVLGALTLVLGGVNQLTVVVGPFLMIAATLSVLRQTKRLDVNQEVPMLMIALGGLILAAYLAPLPPPAWLLPKDIDKK